jgi:uncharacterized membrane protein SpoIIM required for sporulation
MRGHQVLYGARPDSGPAVVRFFTRDFARTVRAQRSLVALACALFFGPLVALAVIVGKHPDFVYVLMPHEQVLAYQEMYDPANRRPGTRGPDADTYMLGHYIWNNIRIGFQTFAGGLLFGVGTVFFLCFNGVMIGATAGYLLQAGYSTSFLSFVAGHSAFELTGTALLGAAGLSLGAALLVPGARPRGEALRRNARAVVPIIYGAATLLACAALIEAFWSPLGLPATIKYGVGAALWIALGVYFLFAGRNHGP